MTTYLNQSFTRENLDIECAFVIGKGAKIAVATPDHPIEIRELAPVPQVAVAIVTDNFHQKVEGLSPAYKALGEWIEANGFQIVGPVRELIHGRPDTNDLTAEIQFPIDKR